MLAVCRAKSCSSKLQTTVDDDRDYFSEIHDPPSRSTSLRVSVLFLTVIVGVVAFLIARTLFV